MAHLQRALATLRISGDELLPDEISALLGAKPSQAQAKGQELTFSSGRTRVAKFGLWRLFSSDTEPENLDAQVSELLGQLTGDLAVWRSISERYKLDLFCGWFMGSSNDGVEISPATLLALGERGIVLALDIYGPDTDT